MLVVFLRLKDSTCIKSSFIREDEDFLYLESGVYKKKDIVALETDFKDIVDGEAEDL